MQLTTIETGLFKLDGGAMFGVVPKVIWNKLNPADENNLCTWAMRCLLIQTKEHTILIDTGIGNKQSAKFFSHYHLHGNHSLLQSLQALNVTPQQITHVILTHLHFDHVGGAVQLVNDTLVPAFPNATHFVTKAHWDHACNPNPREQASFIPNNFMPLLQHNLLQFVEQDQEFLPGITANVVNGHTVGMLCPLIKTNQGSILYAADLFPSAAHIPVNYVMGYDIEPLKTMHDREKINQLAIQNNWRYFLEHDPQHTSCSIALDANGKYIATDLKTTIF